MDNKCSDRSMEVRLSAHLGPTDRPTDQPYQPPTDRRTMLRGKIDFQSN